MNHATSAPRSCISPFHTPHALILPSILPSGQARRFTQMKDAHRELHAAASCGALLARRWNARTALVALALILAAVPATPASVPRLQGDSGGGVRRAQPKAVRSWKREALQHDSSGGEEEPWAAGGGGGEPHFMTPHGPPYRATGVIRPPYYVGGEDKEHPGMVIPVEGREWAHTVNPAPSSPNLT